MVSRPPTLDCSRQKEKEKIVPRSFYENPDVVKVAKGLLGKSLFTRIEGIITGGIIIETEAYAGVNDKASHVYNNRRTKRTEVMYGPGGIAYIYFCYGMHHLINAVTNVEGIAQAVLIRALHPTHGLKTMCERRGKTKVDKTLTSGPGSLCKALGITMEFYGEPLDSSRLWIKDSGLVVPDGNLLTTPRIGVDYAGDDALLPYRFVIL